MENNRFNFFIGFDADLKKSEAEGKRYIRGYASTPNEDRQGESLVQKGLDISDFVNHGYLNFDHDQSKLLGYPTKNTHIDDVGLWVEGVLLKGVPLADEIWNFAVALQKSNAPRRLGFSIEGKVLERRGNTVLKAKIYNCAITPQPVNTEATWEAVVKSFRPTKDIFNVGKSLEAGYATSPEEMTGGDAVRKESLEGYLKVLAEKIDDSNFWERVKNRMVSNGKISKGELVVYLQLAKGLSRKQAKSLIDKIWKEHIE